MYIKQYTNDALSLGFRIVRMQNMNSLSLGFTILRMSNINSFYFSIQIFKAFIQFVIHLFTQHILLWFHKYIHVLIRCDPQRRMYRDGTFKWNNNSKENNLIFDNNNSRRDCNNMTTATSKTSNMATKL